jgi:hypothetical protein
MPAAGYHTEHRWVGAATIDVPDRVARQTFRRGTLTVVEQTTVNVLEVYCGTCRKPFEDAVGTPCHVRPDLHGGPIGERKKRGGVKLPDILRCN